MRLTFLLFCSAAYTLTATENTDRLFQTHHLQLPARRAKELLAVVCPGHVTDARIAAGGVYGCDACPNGDSGSTPGKLVWSLESIVEGHFTAASAENIVVNMSGCEAHPGNFGGSVLLTQRAGKRTKNWYRPGALTGKCRKVPKADKREILFCEGCLYTMDLSLPEPQRFTELMTVEDTMGACFAGAALHNSFIEKVEFPDLDADGRPDLRVTVQTGMTKKFTEAEIAKLCPDHLPQPTMRRTNLEFLFQGVHAERPPFRRRNPARSGVPLKQNN